MTYRIVRGVRDLGQVNGMQVPVFGRNGLEGAVSFAGERLDLNAGCKLAAQAFCPILFFARACAALCRRAMRKRSASASGKSCNGSPWASSKRRWRRS